MPLRQRGRNRQGFFGGERRDGGLAPLRSEEHRGGNAGEPAFPLIARTVQEDLPASGVGIGRGKRAQLLQRIKSAHFSTSTIGSAIDIGSFRRCQSPAGQPRSQPPLQISVAHPAVPHKLKLRMALGSLRFGRLQNVLRLDPRGNSGLFREGAAGGGGGGGQARALVFGRAQLLGADQQSAVHGDNDKIDGQLVIPSYAYNSQYYTYPSQSHTSPLSISIETKVISSIGIG